MNMLGIAQQGLHVAERQVDTAAQRIARAGAGTQAPSDTVNLSDAMVSLLQAKHQFEADLGLAHTADEMQKKTLDLLA